MSITDELRDYATVCWKPWSEARDRLFQMCDRIDEEHQKAIRELNNLADTNVLLPVDADCVPIRVGDVMKGEKFGGGFGEPFEVVGYIMSNGKLKPMDEYGHPRNHEYLHHHHELTVENVLREMADLIYADADKSEPRDRDAIVAKYAAQLRLANDGEEQQ